jgi:uncharacterized protein involved in type VI secretion and phage assembly
MNDDILDELIEATDSRYYGKYRGKVLDNNDPDHRGRLRVSCPALSEEPDDEVWAMPCVPYAGKDRGMVFLPAPGTQVWVEFEAGDPSMPIWSGCYWDAGDLAAADHAPHIKLIKTEKVEIRIDDEENKITISNSFGTLHEIKDGKLTISANAEVIFQVATMKAALNVTKFDIHDGAMSIS